MLYLLKKFWWIFLLLIILFAVLYFWLFGSSVEQYEYTTEPVQLGDLKQTVEATGTVKPASELELGFQTSGVLLEKHVQVGDQVKKDDILLVLDDRETKFQMQQAQAQLAAAQADLVKARTGASSEDVAVSQKSVDKAYTDYQNAEADLQALKIKLEKDIETYQKSVEKSEQDVADAQITLENTIATQEQNIENLNSSLIVSLDKAITDCEIALDKIEDIWDEDDADRYLGIKNSQSINDEKSTRALAGFSISAAKSDFDGLAGISSDGEFDNAISSTIVALEDTFEALKAMYDVLIYSITSASFTSSELDTHKTTVSNQQSTVSTDLSTVKSDQQSILNARLNQKTQVDTAQASLDASENTLNINQANLELAKATKDSQIKAAENSISASKAAWELSKSQLELKQAAPRYVDIATYEARVSQYQVAFELAQKNWQDTVLRAPMDGVITAVNYEIGEHVQFGTVTFESALSMVNLSSYEIEVDISESDIAKVQASDDVLIDFDAFGEELVCEGKVISIDPAETVIQEVIYYTVKIQFDGENKQVKPGMTANVTINTDSRQNVLFIPRRAVIEKDNKKFARVLESDGPREVEITTGLRADDGLIEVLSGLEQGALVITYEKEI